MNIPFDNDKGFDPSSLLNLFAGMQRMKLLKDLGKIDSLDDPNDKTETPSRRITKEELQKLIEAKKP